jgi:hypothetical protein
MVDRWLTATLAVAVIGLAACGGDNGGDNGGEVRTITFPAEQDAPVTGDAILIETRISDAAQHTGEVLSGSLIGESTFCPGGKSSGGSTGRFGSDDPDQGRETYTGTVGE